MARLQRSGLFPLFSGRGDPRELTGARSRIVTTTSGSWLSKARPLSPPSCHQAAPHAILPAAGGSNTGTRKSVVRP